MGIFDDNVKRVLEYTASIPDSAFKQDLLVKLVKDKATYTGVDLIEHFYTKPYLVGNINNVNDACNYLILIPALQKLWDVARARGKENSIRFSGKPKRDDITNIKRTIENI